MCFVSRRAVLDQLNALRWPRSSALPSQGSSATAQPLDDVDRPGAMAGPSLKSRKAPVAPASSRAQQGVSSKRPRSRPIAVDDDGPHDEGEDSSDAPEDDSDEPEDESGESDSVEAAVNSGARRRRPKEVGANARF